ncbi:MAG: protein kinase domain-containing protein, partial [Limisphaerales bacterium]
MAEQQDPVIRRVALKIIKLGMDTKQVIARFEAERQALAMMEHPNIAKVLDAGATDTGRPYFVMELVRGIPITEFCNQQNLDTNARLELFMDVCSAIQHAHQKGVIHRDIKPSNILVTMHDHRAVPKIIDFGIAKATQQKLTNKTLFTQFHHFIGTPAYMSPEQANLSGLDVDTRSDIYSLGVLLYELLTGRTPLDARELTKVDYDEMRRRIREEEPVYPSTQLHGMTQSDLNTVARQRGTEPTRLNKLMRGELDWIVMKALEKDRNRRYETAAEFSLDIQRYLQFEPVKAAAPSTLYRFRKFARRNKGVLATAAVILLLLVAGSVSSTYLAIKATMAQRDAGEAAQRAHEARALAEKREQDALEQRHLVERSAQDLRQNLYASDMYQAQQFLREDNIAKSRELLIKYLPTGAQEPDLRGFEWQYLWDRCQGNELYVFDDLKRPVGAVSFSHNGQWLAGASSEGVAISDVASRRRIALLNISSSQGSIQGMKLQCSRHDR